MKRTIPVLTKADLRKFITFCAEDRASGDFEIHLGLGRVDIAFYKNELNINSPADAKALLKDTFALDDKEREIRAAEQRIIIQKRREEADARLVEQQKQRTDLANTRRKKVSSLSLKKGDQKRQRKLEKQEAQKIKVKKDAWQLPDNDAEGLTPERFRHEICTLGMRFVKDKYNVSSQDIINEANRLKLKIDFDIIPR